MKLGVTELGKKTTHARCVMNTSTHCDHWHVVRYVSYYATTMHSTLSVGWGRFYVKDLGNAQCPI